MLCDPRPRRIAQGRRPAARQARPRHDARAKEGGRSEPDAFWVDPATTPMTQVRPRGLKVFPDLRRLVHEVLTD
ncbi:hypothetical protein TNCT1_70080 [Streptomyces sp. 1-11]|nr:hypothetical protein TNCT1_70080 [Streptomyces sp. 1-11]